MVKGSEAAKTEDKLSAMQRIIFIFLIFSFSLFLNLWNNDFPITYHIDEPKKTDFIINWKQDFHHPILMLNSIRLANLFFRFKDKQKVVELGRWVMAIIGTLGIIIFFFLVRELLPHPYDLITTLLLAGSPILVVHSHYVKEDIFLNSFTLLSLLAYFSFLRSPNLTSSFFLGFSTGLAFSSHFKSILLLPLFLLGPFLFRPENRWLLYRRLFSLIPIVTWFFLAINYPLLFETSTLNSGINHDLHNLDGGHAPRAYPLQHYFLYHLFNSIFPGITPPLAIIGLFAIFFFYSRWSKLGFEDRFLLLYTTLFYFAVELFPLKPDADCMRYIIPVVPGFIYFACKGFCQLQLYLQQVKWKILGWVLFSIVIVFSLQRSIRLIYHINRDTRARVDELIALRDAKTFFGYYAGKRIDGWVYDLNLSLLRRKNYKYVVVSSCTFDQYKYTALSGKQPKHVYRRAEVIKRLLFNPYEEIKPQYISFGYSNPTIRIVEISWAVDNLFEILIPNFSIGIRSVRFIRRLFEKTFPIF
ncbi:ArnT family glycosyltransferase [Candidatus Riflebacteria bacterium]